MVPPDASADLALHSVVIGRRLWRLLLLAVGRGDDHRRAGRRSGAQASSGGDRDAVYVVQGGCRNVRVAVDVAGHRSGTH